LRAVEAIRYKSRRPSPGAERIASKQGPRMQRFSQNEDRLCLQETHYLDALRDPEQPDPEDRRVTSLCR
jgi:hypothetical protein